eukprot:1137446-Pelagomonas_calceolata.AAC.2
MNHVKHYKPTLAMTPDAMGAAKSQQGRKSTNHSIVSSNHATKGLGTQVSNLAGHHAWPLTVELCTYVPGPATFCLGMSHLWPLRKICAVHFETRLATQTFVLMPSSSPAPTGLVTGSFFASAKLPT